MNNDLIINGENVTKTLGITIEGKSRNTLVLYGGVKEGISNESSQDHGVEELDLPVLFASRSFSITLLMVHRADISEHRRVQQLMKLCTKKTIIEFEFDKVVYYLTYDGSSNLDTLNGGGKLLLKFNEPNPNNRLWK